MKNIIRPAIVLLVVCTAAALLLSVVNELTAARIAENQAAAENQAVRDLFGDGIETKELDGIPDYVKKIALVTRNGETLGWSVSVSPNGFGGNIDMVVGISADRKIIGVSITALSETPGLGSRVAEQSYLDGYAGLSGMIRLGEGIDAISGATISSRSVLAGVNRALESVSERSASADASAGK